MQIHDGEADVLATDRYRNVFATRAITPEKRLLVAVLEDALLEFTNGVTGGSRSTEGDIEKLTDWFFGSQPLWPFSFESICESLDLNPERIRQQLRLLARAPRQCRRSCESRGGHDLNHSI